MNKKGFTLIELLIVVTIIGILAVALVPRIVGGSAAARDSRRQTDVNTIATSLEYYLSEEGNFTDIGATGSEYTPSDLAADLANYGGSLPTDPGGNGDPDDVDYAIIFLTDDDGALTKYAIVATLEAPQGDAGFTYNTYPGAAATTTYAAFSAAMTADAAAYSAANEADGDTGYFVVY